jgi:hypothetical protein
MIHRRTYALLLGLAIVASAIEIQSAHGVTLKYELLPGSMITPRFGANPTGPPEALSGTFELTGPYVVGGGVAWDVTALTFSSSSFLLTHNDTPVNDVWSIFHDTPTTYFSEVFNLQGLTISVGSTTPWEGVGAYEGTPELPTFVTYPEMRIAPPGGGAWAASFSFSARLVPEPSTYAIAFVACLAMIGLAKKPRRNH